MKGLLVPVVLLLLLGCHALSATECESGGGLIDPTSKEASLHRGYTLKKFFHGLLEKYARDSAGGVCYFGATTRWWDEAVRPLLVPSLPWLGRYWQKVDHLTVRLCDARLCSKTRWQLPQTRCRLVVVAVKEISLLNHIRALTSVPFWTPSAVHVFLADGSAAKIADDQATEVLAGYGVIRSVLVRLATFPSTGKFTVHFPILFERRLIQIRPTEAIRRWLQGFDQLADLHGYQYRTLYHTLIPYLYRYAGVFGGPDYNFLQTVLERQNATHSWMYHRSDDPRFKSTDLQLVDRRLLEQRRLSFSFNRLLHWSDAQSSLQPMFLNSFDGTCVLVPRRPMPTFILRLWKPFSQHVWYALLAITLLAIAGNLALPRLFAVNYLLALLFGTAVVDYRLRPLDRTILLALDVLLFLLREAYTAKIITYMIQSGYEPELQTVSELARAGPPLLLAPADYEALREGLDAVEPPLQFESRKDYSTLQTSWRDYFRPEYAHAIPCSYGQALVLSNDMHVQDENATRFYLLREWLGVHPEAYIFPRHEPFLKRLHFFATALRESGIYASWRKGDHYAKDRTPTLDEVLRFKNLAALFYVLLVGYIASLGVFFVEHLLAKIRANARRRRLRFWARRSKAVVGGGAGFFRRRKKVDGATLESSLE